jgi:hypothetical protein
MFQVRLFTSSVGVTSHPELLLYYFYRAVTIATKEVEENRSTVLAV